jgi:O-antigen/teichoic acid export membrane protein
MTMKDLKEKAVRGSFARVCTQASNFLLRMGTLMVFARLLTPQDFGLVGMVTAITGVLSLFKDFGLSTATVQRLSISEEQSSTLFWLNMLVGAILGLVSLAIAPVLVAFYGEPRLFWVTVALASGFLFNALGVQHSAILQRQMRFTTLAVIEILSLLASTAVGIGMAIGGLRYWALVGWSIVLPAANSLGAWLIAAWIPGRPRRGAEVRSIILFGGTITLNSVIVYVAYNLDKVLLGRFWGAEALGIYGRAYQLLKMPMDSLLGAVGGVAFSALSRVQEDHNLLKSYFLKGYKMVLALTVPVTISCALFASDIILVFFGPKWKDATAIFQLLAPTILVFAVINPTGWLLFSIGLVGRSLRIALVIAPLVITGYVIGLKYGPNGVAFGFSAMMLLWVVPHILWSVRGTMVSPREMFQAMSKPFCAGIMAGAITFGAQLFYDQMISSPYVRLILGGMLLSGLYSGILLWILGEKTFYFDLLLTLMGRSSLKESGQTAS